MPSATSERSWRTALSAYDRARQIQTSGAGALIAVLPLADRARRRLRAALKASPIAPAEPASLAALIAALEASLMERLDRATSKTLVLELGVAAERGLLAGDTPADRYQFFLEGLADRDFARALMAQYPALTARLAAVIVNWGAATTEMIRRLGRDLKLIQSEIFAGEAVGALVGAASLGDAHAGGRSVHRLVFESGHKLIYKPRPVAMERGVHLFIKWANAHGLVPDLAAPLALDRGSYGWVRYIEVAPCADRDGVRRFYRRQGANLALTYLLGATDLHFENVLAVGEYPVIVDWETLFQARPPRRVTGATGVALDRLNDSVMRTLLLPVRILGDSTDGAEPRSADLSALGYVDGQDAPYPAPIWQAAGTDDMRLAEVFGEMPPGESLPELAGRRVAAAGYLDDIEDGLRSAYGFFASHRDELRAPGGPLARFEGETVRNVFRATARYGQVLGESWHPSHARDRRALRAHLRSQISILDAIFPAPRAIRAAELDDLINGDVPYFQSQVGGQVASAPTRPDVRARLGSNGWATCLQRIDAMNEADLERQIWLTRITFAHLVAATPAKRTRRTRHGPVEIVAMATTIGDRLCDLALVQGRHASWLFPNVEDEFRLAPAVANHDLYNGLAGTALFLGRLAQLTGARRHRETAAAAVNEALSLHRAQRGADVAIGAFEGAGGLAYALALLGRWLDQPAWTDAARALVRADAPAAVTAPKIDLISGRAGRLAAGVAVAALCDDTALLTALAPLAASLRDLPSGALPGRGDAGLAHGKAGVGFALARWAAATNDAASLNAASRLISADIRAAGRARRPPGGDRSGVLAWCRGGVGVAQASLHLGGKASPSTTRLVGELAGDRSWLGGRTPLCPCHGLLGMLEFLETAERANVTGAADLATLARAEALGRMHAGELCSDYPHRLEAPGLMLGLAGTGYALLRMLEPKTTPSVLMLDWR